MEDFVQFIEKYDSFFKLLLALLIIITIWLYFYKKSGSSYSMTDKLWSIFVGQKDFYNKKLDMFHKERHDVDKFNSVYNLNAANVAELEKFTEWVKENGHDIRKISGIKGWFSIANLNVSKPARSMTFLLLLTFFCLVLSGLFVSLCGLTPNAIVKLSKQDPWFIINHQRAKPLFNEAAITADNCADTSYNKGDYSRRSGITQGSVNGICQAFQDKKESMAIDKIIKNQKILFYVGLYIIAFGGLALKYTFRRINALDFIHSSLQKRRN